MDLPSAEFPHLCFKAFFGQLSLQPRTKDLEHLVDFPPLPPPPSQSRKSLKLSKTALVDNTARGRGDCTEHAQKSEVFQVFFFTGAVAHFRLFYLIFLYHLSSQNFKRTNFKDGFQNLKQASMCNSRLTLAGYVR